MFSKSAEYYDKIYASIDKDYAAEVSKLQTFIQNHKKTPGNSLLDVACGTGIHAEFLSKYYQVQGLDLDRKMLAVAKRKHPEIVDPILNAIEGVSLSAIHHLNNPKELGRYMDMNHSLLEALGAGHPLLSKIVLAARAEGAFGAKITGAGGGGCMVALCAKHLKQRVANAIEACDARAIMTGIDTEGARKEKNV